MRSTIKTKDQLFTIDEFLIALPRIIDYIGKEKLSQIIRDENPTIKKPEEKTPEEILEEINNYQGKI